MCAELKSRVLMAAGVVVVMIGEAAVFVANAAAMAVCLICNDTKKLLSLVYASSRHVCDC